MNLLEQIAKGLPEAPKRYELRCHPDVYLALAELSYQPEYAPGMQIGASLYGTADVVVHPEFGSGEWRLYEDGELIKSGRLGGEP